MLQVNVTNLGNCLHMTAEIFFDMLVDSFAQHLKLEHNNF
jgi:hypothetical protein